MANNNNKISIDVEINASGQQQLNQYKGAFDSLRNSIDGLSNPISSLDKDVSKLTNSINQLNSQNDSVADAIDRVSNTSEGLKVVFKGLNQALTLIKGGVISFEEALTGGLSIIIAFLPEIIKFTTELFKGKEAISTMAQNFKNLNEVMKAANKDAAEQTAKLNILYKSATALNNTYADRFKYANQLKAAYPEQFKNMTAESIANGKAKKDYDDLAKSILASAKAKAALNKMTEETGKLLDADYQIEKIKNANYNEVKGKKDELAKQPTFYRGGRSDSELKIFKKDSDDRARTAIEVQNKIKAAIQANIDYLMKFAKDADSLNTKANGSTGNTIANNISIKTRDLTFLNQELKMDKFLTYYYKKYSLFIAINFHTFYIYQKY